VWFNPILPPPAGIFRLWTCPVLRIPLIFRPSGIPESLYSAWMLCQQSRFRPGPASAEYAGNRIPLLNLRIPFTFRWYSEKRNMR